MFQFTVLLTEQTVDPSFFFFFFFFFLGGGGGGYYANSEDTVQKPQNAASELGRHCLLTGGGRVVRRCWLNFQCRGVLQIWIIVGQGPIALAVGAGGGCLDIFSLIYHISFLSP